VLWVSLLILLPVPSCRKAREYFREPDPEPVIETLHTALAVACAADLAITILDGRPQPGVTFFRSNEGFPCTTLMVADLDHDDLFLGSVRAGTLTIAGLWSNESTAILSLILTDYHAGTSVFDLLGIYTIPVIRDAGHLKIALANMDVQLNPGQDALASLDLDDLEIETELMRLDEERPSDVYVAIVQDAYFIDVTGGNDPDGIADDSYTITGGGQLVEVSGSSAEIVQQAMVDIMVSPECSSNPVNGTILMRTTGVPEKGLPELGTVLMEFKGSCQRTVHIAVGTGMYIMSTNKDVPFSF